MMNGAETSLIDWRLDATGESDVADRLSLDQAFAAHHQLVYRYAYALTRDPALAEDVVQEVFVRLYQHLDAAQRNGLLRAWLLRVTASVSRNALRGLTRAQLRDESFAAHSLQVSETELGAGARIQAVRHATHRIIDINPSITNTFALKNRGPVKVISVD